MKEIPLKRESPCGDDKRSLRSLSAILGTPPQAPLVTATRGVSHPEPGLFFYLLKVSGTLHYFAGMILISILLSFGICLPASAEVNPDDFVVTGTFGFDGFYKRQTPSPIFITIQNNGEQFDGWVSADLGAWVPPTYYKTPVSIPSGETRTFELACFGAWYNQVSTITVSLLSNDAMPILRETIQIQMLENVDSLIVHLGEPASDLSSLSNGVNPGPLVMLADGTGYSSGVQSYSAKIYSAVLDPSELPENPILMQGVTLIASNISTWLSLDDQHRDLIIEYVRQGGNILIYYGDGIDPIDGWESDPVLFVNPMGETSEITGEQFSETADAALPEESYWGSIAAGRLGNQTSAIDESVVQPDVLYQGADLQTGDENAPDDAGSDTANLIKVAVNPDWTPPEIYKIIKVEPVDSLVLEEVDFNDLPLLVSRLLGSGHATFAAFDPFSNSPTASDTPVRLLAIQRLLNPMIPSRDLKGDSLMSFRTLIEGLIQEFFSYGSLYNQPGIIRWLDALGPALIYLLGLPILVIIAKGRGQMILGLFIIWSVLFTGFTLSRRNIQPTSDDTALNCASLFWCEAADPEDEEIRAVGATNVYSCMTYMTKSSNPHTLEFHHSPAILDEIVDPQTWSYENLTIEEGGTFRATDLTVEHANYYLPEGRVFTFLQSDPEMYATGRLTVAPYYAHIYLDASIPFPTLSSYLMVESGGLGVGRDFGAHDGNISIDMDLVEGQDFSHLPTLFGDSDEKEIGISDYSQFRIVRDFSPDIPYPLRRLQETVRSMPVNQAQYNLPGMGQDRPLRAYLILTSTEPTLDVSMDRGELELRTLAVTVISIPIAYEEEGITDSQAVDD